MINWREFRAALAVLLAPALVCSPAHALVTFNDSHDHVYVSGSFGMSRDSNVFANSDNQGDVVYNAGFAAEYTRRAGWIGVNANMAVSVSRFGKLKDQNFSNPTFGLELTKQSGRTTGSFTLSGARESRADAAVNLRSTSWNYNTGLNFRYPIAGANTMAGSFGYSSRKYIEDTVFANLATYSSSLNFYHILGSERELIGGYRYRYSETSWKTSSTDHALTAGMSGKLIRGMMGSLQAGYQVRVPHGGVGTEHNFSSWTGSASTSYALTKKIKFGLQLSKDFSTTATDSSVNATSASLDALYAYSSHWSLTGSAGWGDSRFLGEAGRLVVALGPPVILGPSRHDNYANWSAALNYSLNEHLKMAASYSWFQNWSTSSYADFIRSSWNLNLATHW